MRVTAAVLIATAAIVAGVEMARPSSMTLPTVAPPPAARPIPQAAQAPERSAIGTLDRVDVPSMQFVLATADGKLTFHLQNGATIRQGSRTLKPAELAGHSGERVKVRYREVGKVRQANWLVLAAKPSRKR